MDPNVYAECLIQAKMKGWVIPACIGGGILLTLAIILALSTGWGWLVVAGVLVLVYIFRNYLGRLEYEYIFVTDELTIDKIHNAAVRKNAKKIEMSRVEEVSCTRPDRIQQQKANPNAVIEDFTSGIKDAPSYTIVYSDSGKMHYLLFEPDEHLLAVMKKCAPRKVSIQEGVALKKAEE